MKPTKPIKITSLLAGVLALAAILFNSNLQAATLEFTPLGLPFGGAGTWDASASQWSPDGVNLQAWANANYDTAAFTNWLYNVGTPVNTSASSLMVNLNGQTLNVGGLRFEDYRDISTGAGTAALEGRLDYYDITNGTLNFAPGGGSIFVDSGTNYTFTAAGCTGGGLQHQGSMIRAVISGSGTLSKTGPGTLCLLGTNTFAGTLAVNQGWVAVGENAVGGATPLDCLRNITNITIADGAQLGGYGTNVVINPPINLSGNATATIQGNMCPFANTSQAANYKFVKINGGIHGAGNVVFRGNNMIAQLTSIVLNAPCDYNGTTLITVGNGDLYAMCLVDLITGTAFNISQNNFNDNAQVQLGVDNALPTTTVLNFDGQVGVTNYVPALLRAADLYLNGHNQTLAGLSNTNRFARAQRILNLGADSPATLTINNTNDCTFSGCIGNGNNYINAGSVSSTVGNQASYTNLTCIRATTTTGIIAPYTVDGNNISLVKSGAGNFTIMGPPAYTNVNNFALSDALGNCYTNGTIINGGTLTVANTVFSGTGSGPVNINSSGTLAGTGIISGLVTNNTGGTLSPGTGGNGTLTLKGNVVLKAGSTSTFAVNGATPANTRVTLGAANTVTYGGVLNIVPSGTFTVGQTFTLFSGVGATNASQFSSLAGSPGGTNMFTFTNGVLSVVAAPTGPTGAGTITNSFNSGTSTLSLSWPAGQGWRLQQQTNSLSTGLSTNWTYVTDGSVSSTNITVDATKPTVFYRLTYP